MLAWILTALVTVWGILLGGIGFLAWRFYRVEPGEGPAGEAEESGPRTRRSDGRRAARRRGRSHYARRRSRTVYPRRRIPRKVVL